MQQDHPIGFFDSGVGGLTVLREVIDRLPSEDTLYFGDTARVPYGNRSPEIILRYSLQNLSFLEQHDVKLIVVACNTASAHALDCLKEKSPVPVIDVIEPAIRQAAQVSATKNIGVLGTKATIESKIYEMKIRKILPEAIVCSQACPLFVPLVEEEFIHHPSATMIVAEYLKAFKSTQVDTVILGCTHYPLISGLIQKVLGNDVTIIDSASVCAESVLDVLEKNKIKRNLLMKGKRKYYVSDDPEKFQRIGERFLGIPIEKVELYIH